MDRQEAVELLLEEIDFLKDEGLAGEADSETRLITALSMGVQALLKLEKQDKLKN